MEMLLMSAAMVLPNNLILSLVKWLAEGSVSKVWLRVVLLICSMLGIIAIAAVTGEPLDLNRLSEIGTLVVGTVIAAVVSHFTYSAIKKA